MTDSDKINFNDLLNDSKTYETIDNAVSLLEDYGDNCVILNSVDSKIEQSQILFPLAVRKDKFRPYKYGLIDKDYKIIAEPKYDVIVDNVFIHEQLIRVGKTVPVVYERPKTSFQLMERYGVIDTHGNTILEPEFDDIYFADNFNLIVVSNGPTNTNQGAGLFDRFGKEILPMGTYYKIYGFYKGLVRVIKDGKWGIINSQGKLLLPTIYNNIWNFDGKDYDSIIVEKDGVKSYIAISDIIRGKIIPNYKYSDDLPF